MKLSLGTLAFLAGVFLSVSPARAVDCSGLPTSFTGNEFPTGNFFSNFDGSLAPCYLIGLSASTGAVIVEGDLNATYYTIYFKVDPRYQVVVVGDYPNARFMQVALYDQHFAPIPYLTDSDIVPLTNNYVNPFKPGTAYVAGQRYAVPVNMGGTPGAIQTGCSTSAFNVDVNALDGTQRHQSMNWNSDAGFSQKYPGAPLHVMDTPQHTNPNSAIMMHIRTYLNTSTQVVQDVPHVILRDVASGCAYPAAYAVQTLKELTLSSQTARTEWLDYAQEQNHLKYQNYLPQLCYAVDPQNQIAWERGGEYVQGGGLTDSYIQGTLPNGLPQTLAAAGEVVRIRLRLPTSPPTPCTNGCSRSGNEQQRYTGLSFVSYQAQACNCNTTLASVADSSFTQDSNGYATLIVGTGAKIPSWVTPANGYTFLDLTTISGYQQFNTLVMRNILANSTFGCSSFVIPYFAEEYTPTGNLTSDYAPVVDYPVATSLPATATALVRSPSCGVFPFGRPAGLTSCTVLSPVALGVTGVTTQCAAPGCASVVVQPQPPLTITGHGMGLFPDGLPYTGTTSFLKITDLTQAWEAGYGTDKCTVTIYNWSSNLISLVANVNQNGMCPMAAGDQLFVQVWNPQTPGGSPASFSTVVSTN